MRGTVARRLRQRARETSTDPRQSRKLYRRLKKAYTRDKV